MIGLDVENLVVDGCIVESTLRRRGRRPLPGRSRETRNQTLSPRRGRRHPTRCRGRPGDPQRFRRYSPRRWRTFPRFGFELPEKVTVHLDAGWDSGKARELLTGLGCDVVISTKAPRYKPEPAGSWNA
jgi:hypothetical protein